MSTLAMGAVAAVTESCGEVPLLPSSGTEAVIVAAPAATPVTSPEAFTVATVGAELDQVT
jgi:hypothetical protein